MAVPADAWISGLKCTSLQKSMQLIDCSVEYSGLSRSISTRVAPRVLPHLQYTLHRKYDKLCKTRSLTPCGRCEGRDGSCARLS
jgi:hypothetical protein